MKKNDRLELIRKIVSNDTKNQMLVLIQKNLLDEAACPRLKNRRAYASRNYDKEFRNY